MSKENNTVNAPKKDTGFLHATSEKSNENAPDYFGQMDVNGILFKLAGWVKTGTKNDKKFIQLNLDIAGDDIDSQEKTRAAHLKDFKADRKKDENKDTYILIEQTGTLHTSDEDKKEDFFGRVLLGGKETSIIGFTMSGKKGIYVMLKVNTGLASKEDRAKLTADFI
jgi:hypothetical protein